MKNWSLIAPAFVCLSAVCLGQLADFNNPASGADWWIKADSENGKFAAVLIRPSDMNDCMLEVYEVNGPENKLLWKANAPCKVSGGDVFVSNDGIYVVTLDDRKEPKGDALEFYARERGKIKGYSRQEVLGICEKKVGKNKKAPFPSFSLFHSSGGLTYFCACVWGKEEFHWVCWNAATGEYTPVNEALAKSVCEHVRQQFRKQLAAERNGRSIVPACLFLLRLKKAEDRALIERLLADENFWTHWQVVEGESIIQKVLEKVDIDIEARVSFDGFCAQSQVRELADTILAVWDGKIEPTRLRRSFRRQAYFPQYYLGGVSLDVVLTAKPKKRGGLWVYLVPESVGRDQWASNRPVHYLKAEFKSLDPRLEPGQKVRCVFRGVTLGKYWIKAVWDKEKPFYNGEDKFYKPQKGDYESTADFVVQVKAGEMVDVGTIECKQKVKGK